MITNEAIVLAGGLGTRLAEVLPETPKCMALIGEKPFLAYVLDYLAASGISKVILSVGYRNDQVISYFVQTYKSIELVYAIETEPLGTGGAVKSALEYTNLDEIFVLNGDTYFAPDLMEMEQKHIENSADVTIAVKQFEDTSRYGRVVTNTSGRITGFKEKQPEAGNGWINGGIYLLKRSIIDSINEQKFSLENEVFRKQCASFRLQAFYTDAFFLDIGVPTDLEKAQTLIPAQNKVK